MMEAVIIDQAIKIDKSTWQLVKFGDVVFEPKESCRDIIAEGIEHVVGLEHIDSEDMHLKRSASSEESTTFTKMFRKGDVLFGRRRAYLKKAALASFDGICSGDITVFRTNEELSPALLPFVVNNDKFFDYAVKHSAGGLSPRVKFKDLANYEFLLPPKSEQARLAELLWAMDEVVEKEKKLLEKLKITWNTSIENLIHGMNLHNRTINEVLHDLSKKIEIAPLEELGDLLKGRGIPKADVVEDGIPCVRYGELYTKHNQVIRDFYSYIDNESKSKSFKLKKNDILFAGSGETITEIGKSAAFVDNIEAYGGSDMLIFRPFEMDGYFSGYLMNSILVRQQLNKYGTGATIMHIYNSDLKKIKIPLHSIDSQKQIAKKLEEFANTYFIIQEQIEKSQSLQKSLINQIF